MFAYNIYMAQRTDQNFPNFDLIRDQSAEGKATEVSEGAYWYALEVLPPIYAPGMFAICEPQSHLDTGEATYHWFCKRGKRYYGALGTKAQAISIFATI